MLSKNKLKFFSSFASKKVRIEHGLFIVEGNKMIDELLVSQYKIHSIVARSEWIEEHSNILANVDVHEASAKDLETISLLKSPQDSWALVHESYNENPLPLEQSELVIALDTIQDPGNLGTIIRLADWFGVRQVWCSSETVDVYNPKVVQASMGSVFRVHVLYTNLSTLLAQHTHIPIYAADLQGTSVYDLQLSNPAILVMGNEGNGLSQEILPFVSKFVHIPTFSSHTHKPESLNVSVATAILCSEFKRGM